MDELAYYKAKAKLLEFQSRILQLNEEMNNLNRERTKFYQSVELDPGKNYKFNDETLEFTEIILPTPRS